MCGKELCSFTVKGRLPGLNDYTLANRANRFGGSKLKRDAESIVLAYLPADYKVPNYPVMLDIEWYEKDNRRDADNVFFSVKFILDAMVKAGILVDDSRKFVSGIKNKISTDKLNPRIEVRIYESDETVVPSVREDEASS